MPRINEIPQEAAEHWIILLQSVHESEDSWQNALKGQDDDENLCTKAKVFEIWQTSRAMTLKTLIIKNEGRRLQLQCTGSQMELIAAVWGFSIGTLLSTVNTMMVHWLR
jgi:hypothetical protein